MAADALHHTFQSLIDRGFITGTHRDQALRHPKLGELQSMPSQSNALVWLVTRDILPEKEFFDVADKLASTKMEDELRRCRDLVDTVKEGLCDVRHALNQQSLATLFDEGLITLVQHDVAAEAMPRDRAFKSPAAMLAWLRMVDAISAEDMRSLRERAGRQGQFASEQAALIVTEADRILAATNNAIRRASVQTVWYGFLPGPAWLWMAIFIGFIGWMIWWAVAPASPPSCTSDSVRKQVSGMIFMAQVKARTHNPLNMDRSPAGFPEVSNLKEIGYAKAERSRACGASLKINGAELPYVFTITPASSEELKRSDDSDSPYGGFLIAGADERIVHARYEHLDADGRFAHQAQPIGRTMMEKAFRAGVESYNKEAGVAALDRMRSRHAWLNERGSEPQTRRTREIAEVEPLAPCRESSPRQVVCRVLIERNDPMLAALGWMDSTVVEGEFSFERDASGDGWHVDDGKFADEFRKAILLGRAKQLTGG